MTKIHGVAMDRINELHASGIKKYVTGDHAGAKTDWITASNVALNTASYMKLDLGTRYLRAESWTNGIGHIALLDFFAKRRILGMSSLRHVVVTKPGMIANQSYLNMWRRYFDFVDHEQAPRPEADLLQEWPMVLGLGGWWTPMMDAVQEVEERWQALRGPSLMALSQRSIDLGWMMLSGIGIPQGRWFATFHVREGGAVSGTADDLTSIRNANLSDYAGAVQAVIDAGGHPIRVGRTQAAVPVPGLIDMGGTVDSIDVFLLSQCRFFVGVNSGPAWVAGTFGVPSVLTNWAPRAVGYGYAGARILHKELMVRCEPVPDGDRLTYIESAAILAEHGAAAAPNSPASIEGAVIEMMRELGSEDGR